MNTPILDELLKINKQEIISFHMPGHKNGQVFNKLNAQINTNLAKLDTTEIKGTDNLHNPKGAIKKAKEIATSTFKSKESFFLVNGSTSGILSMIMATTYPGDKIIINRNCHQSIIHACILADLTPVYVYPKVDYKTGIDLGVEPDDVEQCIINNIDAKAVLITYPNYYGIASNLKKISKIVHSYDKILLVDEAHGAHLGLSDQLPLTALECGADITVQSVHKTLPAFTQSAIMHIQGNRVDEDRLKFMLRVHQSSSPSYILMVSIEQAIKIYQTHGRILMEELLFNIQYFVRSMEEITKFRIGLPLNQNSESSIDLTKLWIQTECGIDGYKIEKHLRDDYNVQVELSNIFGILGLCSIGNEKKDFDQLIYALYDLETKVNVNKKLQFPIIRFPKSNQITTPRQGINKPKKTVLLKESIGEISGEFIIPYPPGVPILIPGELISEEIINYIQVTKELGMEVLGLKDEKGQYIDIIKN
ncbi:aminotransferase class I/II-fold pyridoxal phosphate-dependent enzyme [Serpentinicella sp. ANB-PHB4]|uniref:aminotransferase class I/II-fold pyridoxal phosphate-dependent enzyme n=1 Tax=Serpentinicella sp. ANB-PHB4 TaxID=3074076 RepID=UPI00285F0981|nr:aminotransferase class I/II-fold pyridoxal phosphate-dependent enzyme [Serpentinicella sp. ANB-PHB4]MDR5659222.1 aminotransferase class I/II-fold pyridoxal phosphate-dependent enzyme [Serpentinicella sp. ANB-PHB4]